MVFTCMGNVAIDWTRVTTQAIARKEYDTQRKCWELIVLGEQELNRTKPIHSFFNDFTLNKVRLFKW